jgi:DNA repair exonuclease SbcCD nuclease subunit
MKIIHCADIHFGSKMEARLPKEKSDERKSELRAAFAKMLDFAVKEGVSVVLLVGDVFDSDRSFKKDRDFFYGAVRAHADIDFLYLRGNHDEKEKYLADDLPNLKTFGDEWTKYSYGTVEIHGAEISSNNSLALYSSLKALPNRKNIVLLHGTAGESTGKDKVNLTKLRGKNIDYLALGHIHSYEEGKVDDRGRYAFSGCLEGRGFDEIGEKGFLLLTVDENSETGKIESEFIPNSVRRIEEFAVDITGADGVYATAQIVRSRVHADKKDLCRVVLKGEIDFDNDTLASDLERILSQEYYFVSVKDETARKFDLTALTGDLSLRGEFLRGVLSDETLSEDEKQKILSIGLKALSGREVD